MARLDFCGGSYTLATMNADAQRTVNLIPEVVESGDGRSKMILLNTPGLALIAQLDGPPRAQLEYNGNLFVVGAKNFYQINLTSLAIPGTPTTPIIVTTTVLNATVPLANDGLSASIAGNQNQLLIASAGNVYVYYVNAMSDSVTGATVPAGTFKQVPVSNFTLSSGNAPVKQVAFCDSFFLALIANSQSIQISNVLDGFNWIPGGSIVNGTYTGGVSTQIVVSVYTDNVVGIVTDHRVFWALGRKKTVGYASGDPQNIFAVIPGSLIEQGAAATFAISQADNSVLWVSADDKGDRMAFRLNGLTPQRISTHAIETAWRVYPKASDAVSYTYQDGGHSFWVVLFPSANRGNGATWVYDVASGLWHERDYLNVTSGVSMGHPSWNHSYWNGAHMVGDWRSPNLYQMDVGFFDNAGVPITRVRRAPHVATELEMLRYDRFILDVETGVGPVLKAVVPSSSTILKDSSNQLWNLTVLDTGVLQTTAVGVGTPQTLILNDQGNTTSWLIGVSTTGLLTATSQTFSAANPLSLAMNSPSFNWQLRVTSAGLIQTYGTGEITRPPSVWLRFSDDGAHTWSNRQQRSMGNLGEYKVRVVWHRLGAARVRTIEISCSDPVPFRITDAYINATPDYKPAERITHQYRKVA